MKTLKTVAKTVANTVAGVALKGVRGLGRGVLAVLAALVLLLNHGSIVVWAGALLALSRLPGCQEALKQAPPALVLGLAAVSLVVVFRFLLWLVSVTNNHNVTA
jgi:hypothetical protein